MKRALTIVGILAVVAGVFAATRWVRADDAAAVPSMAVEKSTFDPEAEGYLVVATKE